MCCWLIQFFYSLFINNWDICCNTSVVTLSLIHCLFVDVVFISIIWNSLLVYAVVFHEIDGCLMSSYFFFYDYIWNNVIWYFWIYFRSFIGIEFSCCWYLMLSTWYCLQLYMSFLVEYTTASQSLAFSNLEYGFLSLRHAKFHLNVRTLFWKLQPNCKTSFPGLPYWFGHWSLLFLSLSPHSLHHKTWLTFVPSGVHSSARGFTFKNNPGLPWFCHRSLLFYFPSS